MSDALTCFPAGCPGCPHATDDGCELMGLLDEAGIDTINTGTRPARAEHPIESYATA